jgi:hypothetical protein
MTKEKQFIVKTTIGEISLEIEIPLEPRSLIDMKDGAAGSAILMIEKLASKALVMAKELETHKASLSPMLPGLPASTATCKCGGKCKTNSIDNESDKA